MGIVSNWPTLLRWIARGDFPPGAISEPNTRAWSLKEVEAWLAIPPRWQGRAR